MRRVWIVEMWNAYAERKQWDSTVGCALSRSDARDELDKWRAANPEDKFRLVTYVPKEK